MNITTPLPTDYGPDNPSPLARVLRLPPAERPPRREIIKLAKRTRPKRAANATDVMISEWMAIPPTTPEQFIVDGAALTIPDANGGLDWHDAWHYARFANETRRIATLSTDRPANLVLAHIREHWLGTNRIIDARWGLARKGHPDAQGDGPPVWAESHERSTVDRVLRSAVGRPFPPAPNQPKKILDRRTVYRWIATEEQLEWVGSTLLAIADQLPPERATPIRAWVANVVDNHEPTE